MLTGEMSSHAKHLGELPQGPYLSLLGRRRCSDVDDGPQSGCDKQKMRDSYLPIGSGWQRDPPVRGAGYEPSDKDSYAFGSLLCTCLAAATR